MKATPDLCKVFKASTQDQGTTKSLHMCLPMGNVSKRMEHKDSRCTLFSLLSHCDINQLCDTGTLEN